MYLELSPRCTGKTSRLIQEALLHACQTQDEVFIITLTAIMKDHIKRCMGGYSFRITVLTQLQALNWFSYIGKERNMMFFFDEFDFMYDLFPHDGDIAIPRLCNDKYYYATTERTKYTENYRRSYIVDKLISMNNGEYRKYHNFENYSDVTEFKYNSMETFLDGLFVKELL